MNAAIGRIHLSISLTTPHDEDIDPSATRRANALERAFKRNQMDQTLDRDRQRWLRDRPQYPL